tara:strand:+ start:7118 stop:7528 length:411 start_codon:yes stop_codon:yes gene_type:complete
VTTTLLFRSQSNDSTGTAAPDAKEINPGSPFTRPQSVPSVSIQTDSVLVTIEAAPDVPPIRPLSERMRFDTEGLEVVVHPDGRKSLHLQGRYMHMATAAVDDAGNKIAACTSNHDHVHDMPRYAVTSGATTLSQIR